MRLLILATMVLVYGCGSGETKSTQSAVVSGEESIFQDWNVAIPQAEGNAIAALNETNSFVSPGVERSFDDIVNGRRLNLSQLKYGKNVMSVKNYGGCDYSAEFSISIYTGGQIIVSRTKTWNSSNGACANHSAQTESLYYKYTVLNGRVNVCGYDDAAMTLERGCMGN